MEERAYEAIRRLPRGQLEAFALRAVVTLHEHRNELDPSRVFLAALAGFLSGAVVAAAGFLFGTSLS